MVIQVFLTRGGWFRTFLFVNIFYPFRSSWIKFSPCWHKFFSSAVLCMTGNQVA